MRSLREVSSAFLVLILTFVGLSSLASAVDLAARDNSRQLGSPDDRAGGNNW